MFLLQRRRPLPICFGGVDHADRSARMGVLAMAGLNGAYEGVWRVVREVVGSKPRSSGRTLRPAGIMTWELPVAASDHAAEIDTIM